MRYLLQYGVAFGSSRSSSMKCFSQAAGPFSDLSAKGEARTADKKRKERMLLRAIAIDSRGPGLQRINGESATRRKEGRDVVKGPSVVGCADEMNRTGLYLYKDGWQQSKDTLKRSTAV